MANSSSIRAPSAPRSGKAAAETNHGERDDTIFLDVREPRSRRWARCAGARRPLRRLEQGQSRLTNKKKPSCLP